MSFHLEGGRVFRAEGQPLRTKIVATLGNPVKYPADAVDLNGDPLGREGLSYEALVRGLILNGADVVRLNLSHINTDAIEGVFVPVKQALLEMERSGLARKRVAILADLPGPKIRFRFASPVSLRVGQPFHIDFANTGGDGHHNVFVSDQPLKVAMANDDRARPQASVQDNMSAEAVNLIGHTGGGGSFDEMMQAVAKRLAATQEVQVIIGDGDAILRVETPFDPRADVMRCSVVSVKGPLSGNKGFTLKGIDFNVPSFTLEDQAKLDKLLECEYRGRRSADVWQPVIAFVAVSFAQTASDVLRAKYHMVKKIAALVGRDELPEYEAPALIAKIESNKGWLNRDYILDVADGFMVARGDLGLQMEVEKVPAIQKSLVQLCNKRGKPVITATEMLKSMTASSEPTRAEGTDVFNAILDGSDAVMLSEETASGRFPFHAVRKMVALAVEAEEFEETRTGGAKRSELLLQKFHSFFVDSDDVIQNNTGRLKALATFLTLDHHHAVGAFMAKHRAEMEWYLDLYRQKVRKTELQRTTDRVTQAACTMSEADEVGGILAASTSGRTVRMIARVKPRVPVVGAAHDVLNARKLIISYGVWPICIGATSEQEGPESMFEMCVDQILNDKTLQKLLAGGDIIFTAGAPVATPGTTNLVQIRPLVAAR
jgi:pyruvate kinase